MTATPQRKHRRYLAMDAFLATETAALALISAFDHGIISRLARGGAAVSELAESTDLPQQAIAQITALLCDSGVLSRNGQTVRLTPAASDIALYDTFVRAKTFSGQVAQRDIRERFDDWAAMRLANGPGSAMFELFRYDLCTEITLDNLRATKRWVDVTTALTTYEAIAFAKEANVEPANSWLDVGGNSGEFCNTLMQSGLAKNATVFDLPVVCEIGRTHLRGKQNAYPVEFCAGDMRVSDLPNGHDVVSLKSVAHDWPDADVIEILTRVSRAMTADGRLIIFERASLGDTPLPTSFAQATNLIFAAFYRTADQYTDLLRKTGFNIERQETLTLDWPFHLIVARRAN